MKKSIFKLITDAYWKIMDKHNNHQWALDELEWLVYEVNKDNYNNLTHCEKADVDKIMNVLKK